MMRVHNGEGQELRYRIIQLQLAQFLRLHHSKSDEGLRNGCDGLNSVLGVRDVLRHIGHTEAALVQHTLWTYERNTEAVEVGSLAQ
jgi:hypothetical protein